MCQCSFQGFFSYGGMLTVVMGMQCAMIANACPEYPNNCPFGFYVLAAMVPFLLLQSCTMIAISHGLAKVEKLSLDELSPDTISPSIKRWGWVVSSCPNWSRKNHTIIGIICMAGMGVAGGVCTSFVESDACQPPFDGLPNPIRDFGVLTAIWLFICALGCRAVTKNTALPHIYEPVSADGTVVGQACCLFKLCHP